MKIAGQVYRRLAQAFPHEFKLAFGAGMMDAGEYELEQMGKRQGAAGISRMLADLAVRLPIEYLAEIRQDLRYAARALAHSPGFALVGVVSMGIGIGLTTNVFSSRWALLTRELPAAANVKRLVIAEKPVSSYYIDRYREQKAVVDGAAALENGVPFNVTLEGGAGAKAERVFGQIVSPDYFAVLGVGAQRGRVLSAELDKAGNAPVVVISDRFWRGRLNAAPDAIGQTLRLNGQTATIVGITPRKFDGALAMNPSELFVPTTVPATLAPELGNDVLHQRNAKEFIALLCLKQGVTIDAAEAALNGVTRRLDVDDPGALPQTDKAKRVILLPAGTRVPIPRNLRPAIEGFFFVLMALVMAIACMNLANMLLARGAHRRRELAIRMGVGASRFRLIRQMISEGILLSLLGGAAGLGLAWGLNLLASQVRQPTGAPVAPDVTLDWRAAAFAFAVSFVCGIGFSVAPALQATKTDVAAALKVGSELQLPGYRRFGLRNLAVAAQVTGSLMLLLITGFLVIGLSKQSSIDMRFDPGTMALVSVDPVRDGYTAEKSEAFFAKVEERLRAESAVQKFALAAQPPFTAVEDDDRDFVLTVDGAHGAPRVEKPVAEATVGAGYFAALNEPVLAGREFTEADVRSADERNRSEGTAAAMPLLLNETAARDLFGSGDAVGRRVRKELQAYDVTGVVRDVSNGSGINQPIAYLPLASRDFARPPAGGITILVRAAAGADAMGAVRRAIGSIDPNLTLFGAETLSESLERSRYVLWSALRTYGGIGVFGLILSALGLAGVTAYAVARRGKEIGIRMALGASRGQVLRLVLREGAALIAVGLALGFAGALALVKALSAMANLLVEAFRMGTGDLRLLVGAPLLLAALALVACYVPARRAVKIDPLKALRQE